MSHLYFAYGSCMDIEDLRRTTPAEVVTRGVLNDYRLAFTRYSRGRKGGVADIVHSVGDYVEGVVFRVQDLAALDAREGCPKAYRRRRACIVAGVVHPQLMNVWTYEVVNKSREEIAPSETYQNLIMSGADKYLSKEYRKELKRNLKRFEKNERYSDYAELEMDWLTLGLEERFGKW
ncbi:gamma-glutamyl cyclotransferase [Bacillus phage 055SW001]|nr:gamma-glutamyl cyclotransferase [Bacillus phage 022DV001]QFG05764.1 gamma-glutamyl cyclotransferase [Bacillus phage 055SW001]